MSGIVIIGAGHAGVQLAASLRDAKLMDSIRLVSDDPDFPYHKPPLSKSFMAAEDKALQPLRGEAFFTQNNIDLNLGVEVTKIGRADKCVVCADGATISYDRLVIATGTSARKIQVPGADLPQVFELRTATDARAMRSALPDMKNVVVNGGGFASATNWPIICLSAIISPLLYRSIAWRNLPPHSCFVEQNSRHLKDIP